MSRQGAVLLAGLEVRPCGGRQLHRHIVPFPVAQAVRYGPAQAELVISAVADFLPVILELDRKAVLLHDVAACVHVRIGRVHHNAKMEDVSGVPVGRQVVRAACACGGGIVRDKIKPVIRVFSMVELHHLGAAAFRIVNDLAAKDRFNIDIHPIHEKDEVIVISIAQRRGLRLGGMRDEARAQQKRESACGIAG